MLLISLLPLQVLLLCTRCTPVLGYASVPIKLEAGHPLEWTLCISDVGQSVLSLGEMANAIFGSVQACETTATDKDKAACSTNIGAVLATMFYVMSFTSLSLTDCVNNSNIEAQCAGDITGFLNAFATLTTSASSLATGTCKNVQGASVPDAGRRLQDTVIPPDAVRRLQEMQERHARYGRKEPEAVRERRRELVRSSAEYQRIMAAAKRVPQEHPEDKQYRFLDSTSATLQAIHEQNKEKAARSSQIAACTFDVGQAGLWLMRASAAIAGSVTDCGPKDLFINPQEQLKCTVQIAGVLGSLLYVTQYIQMIIFHCPVENDLRAGCGIDVTGILTVLTSLIAGGSALPLSCANMSKKADPLVFANRRLASNVSNQLNSFV